MKQIIRKILPAGLAIASGVLMASAGVKGPQNFDFIKFRYQKESPSVFHDSKAQNEMRLRQLMDMRGGAQLKGEVTNPKPAIELGPTTLVGNIDAPNGELWYYIGDMVYEEIPPHDNVWFTDRILQEYTFTIYDGDMNQIGVLKDKMDYADNEVRVVLCEITPVATRNFFNTDDKIELMVALAVNIEGGGNNYRTLVYALDGEKDEDGDDKVIDIMPDLVGDVIEGPSTDGTDNFYITFTEDIFEPEEGGSDDGFWPYLLAQKAGINVYGKAIDDSGPRLIFSKVIPLIQLPGDQQDVPALISLRNGEDVVFCISEYKEPFYNRYDDPMSEELTQREGNSLIINLYKASEDNLTVFSTTEIPVVLDPMKDADGNPTCLFSYFSVGNLGHRSDILFDAPGVEAGKPDFIITRGNYQVSTDGITNSYFTYKNDGTLKNTLFLYADGTRSLGNIEGFEPQQLFVSRDTYGYVYNFVNLYSAKTATMIDADYYYDDDSDSELLTATVDRTPAGDSYQYVFELRYPQVDDDENDLLRFMYINADGSYDHIEYVNMGKNVAYAQSYITTQALAPHAYSTSDVPTFMCLVKRGVEDAVKIEELMVAEAMTEENPQGKTLLQVGPSDKGILASIVPEFGTDNKGGRLFVYYYDDAVNGYTMDIYSLPLNDEVGAVDEITDALPGLDVEGSELTAAGEIRVYTLDGKEVAAGTGRVEFASLQKGVYIVKVGDKTYKIVK